jgi:uncharacterized protein YjbI with pentapeptide repeats
MSQLTRGDILDRLAAGESLRAASLVRADLSAMDLTRIDLTGANLRMADLSGSDLKEARLTGCSLSGATLNEANLVGANLVEASLIGVLLKGADVSRADLSGADLTGANLESTRLEGAYLVGAFLNETDLSRADLSGAFVRMAQMAGSTLAGATLDGADLSHADLSGVRFDGCSMVGVTLAGANLSASTLSNCDLRNADVTGADLSGCNLTGAKLSGIKFSGVKLNDTWAEWINLSADGKGEERATLTHVFAGMLNKPLAEILIQGRVNDDAWAVILSHLCDFRSSHSASSDVKLKALQQGVNSSALYLEAGSETTLAAYFSEFAKIMGKGSDELIEKLDTVLPSEKESRMHSSGSSNGRASASFLAANNPLDQALNLEDPLDLRSSSHAEAMQATDFWSAEKAIVILTGDRRVWLEAASGESLTIRPPHGSNVGIDLIRGRFVTEESRRQQQKQPKTPVHG